MKAKDWIKALTLLWGIGLAGQIKIGENPQNIHPASVLELESTDRVFVLTRMGTNEMNALQPLAGAIVFNEDVGCLYLFTGNQWENLCETTHSPFMVGDNEIDFTQVTLSDFLNDTNFLTRPDLLSNAQGNSLSDAHGVYYNDSSLREALTAISVSLEGDEDSDPLNELQQLGLENGKLSISEGNSVDLLQLFPEVTDNQHLAANWLDESELELSIEGGNSLILDFSTLEGSNGGTDNQNLTSAVFSGTALTISIEDGNAVTADLSALATDSELAALDIRDADADPGNELQQLSSLDGSVEITTNGNNFDLSVTGGGSDNQNLTGAVLSGTALTISIENGDAVTADLSALATDSELAALDIRDADADPGNELQQLSSLDGSVEITTNGNNFDLSVTGGGSDNQNLTGAVLSGTALTISIEDGDAVTADLSALATDSELAALDIRDADADPGNELQRISSPDASILVQQTGNDYELQLAGIPSSANLATTNLTQTGGDRIYELDGQNLSFAGSGSMGIGTTNPQSKLHVSGQVRSSGYANSNGVAGEPSYAFNNDPDTGMWRGGNVDYLRFSTAGIEALTITPDQNVGIGTDSPSERLHVNGNILAAGSITPDYVFEAYFTGKSNLKPGYHLLPLDSLEQFVRKHHHLPDIPSAGEVKNKGGIVVNEATQHNLEKIEELVLYLIEQNKELRELKRKIWSMEQKVTARDSLKQN